MTDNAQRIPVWKQWLFAGILALVLPGVVLLGIEGAARLIIHIKYGVPGKTYGLWQADPELGAIHASNAYNSNSETNELGFRNREHIIDPKPPAALRIIAYGGSTTFCYNLSTDLAWPLRLQEILRDKHNESDQVLNAGAIMWSLGHEFARAKRDLPKLKPDYVILYSGVNEEANWENLAIEGIKLEDEVARGHYGFFTRNLDQSRWLKRNSTIVRFWDYVLAGIMYGGLGAIGSQSEVTATSPDKPRTAPFPTVSQNFNGILRNFIDLIRSQGGQPIYVVMGGLHDVGPNQRLLTYSSDGAAVAREMGVPVIDANEVVKAYSGSKSDLFISSGIHWTEKGALLLSQYIYEKGFR